MEKSFQNRVGHHGGVLVRLAHAAGQGPDAHALQRGLGPQALGPLGHGGRGPGRGAGEPVQEVVVGPDDVLVGGGPRPRLPGGVLFLSFFKIRLFGFGGS